MSILDMSPRDLVMVPSGTPGYWVRGSVADARPWYCFVLPLDGPVRYSSDELAADGWVLDTERVVWVKP